MEDNSQSGDGRQSALVASRLLWKFSETISQAIATPDVLAEKLLTKWIISLPVYQAAISPNTRGKDRSQELLKEVCDRIKLKSVSFEDFLQALKELPQVGTLPDVITSLQAEHGKINCNKLVKVY